MPTLTLDDYGIIGNYTSAALVNRFGSLDWCCFPFLDSPSHFAAILDQNLGGKFQIAPQGDFRSEQRYLQRSLVLETVFETPFGRGILTDWMPLQSSSSSEPVVYRQLDVVEGKITWVLVCDPRFDYGETHTEAEFHGARESENSRSGLWSSRRLLFRGSAPGQLAQLFSSIDLDVTLIRRSAEARFTLSAGQSALFAWAWGRRADAPLHQSFKDTVESWRKMAHHCLTSGCLFAGPWHDAVVRSGMFLKVLIAPYSGSVAEAITTSIPGSQSKIPSTADHRYAWIQNSGFTLQALAALGLKSEAKNYFSWLSEIVIRDGVEMLQSVYTLDGGKPPVEVELSHLKGFRGAGPVRTGSNSANHFHLDAYGHVLLAADFYQREWGELPETLWPRIEEIAEFVCNAWRRPDHGPEEQGKTEHFVSSKALCWAALDRACLIAKRLGKQIPPRWLSEMEVLHRTICSQGFDTEKQSFVRSFGETEIDASVLILPLIGFLPADDPRIASTLDAVQSCLSEGVLVHGREGGDDPDEQTSRVLPLLRSSFLFVANLALAGRVDEASDRMGELCSFATHLGFFGENVDLSTAETIGNFPDATVHLSLITAALYIGAARGRELSTQSLLGIQQESRAKIKTERGRKTA